MPKFDQYFTVAERKKAQEEYEKSLLATLKKTDKVINEIKAEKKQKKKPTEILMAKLNLEYVTDSVIRDPNDYVAKSYNEEKQLIGLINHMFVKYRVPDFFYYLFLQPKQIVNRYGATTKQKYKYTYMFDIYKKWFVTIAQGGSFRKEVKHIMSSKEAALFLKGPCEEIHENIWWAKMVNLGISNTNALKLIDRVFGNYFPDMGGSSKCLHELLHFYAHNIADMDKDTFNDTADYICTKIREDAHFSFKGRTLNSIIMLSNEWHHQMQKAKLGQNCQWEGMGIPLWIFDQYNNEIWDVQELTTNKQLLQEGKKNRHCVYSYVNRCMNGSSYIFSMRGYNVRYANYNEDGVFLNWDYDLSSEFTRITIEADRFGHIIQIRGPWNRRVNEKEYVVLRHWAGEKGLKILSRA